MLWFSQSHWSPRAQARANNLTNTSTRGPKRPERLISLEFSGPRAIEKRHRGYPEDETPREARIRLGGPIHPLHHPPSFLPPLGDIYRSANVMAEKSYLGNGRVEFGADQSWGELQGKSICREIKGEKIHPEIPQEKTITRHCST